MMDNKTKNQWGPIIIIGALFFLFGFVTWLNATLIPYLKIACELTDFEAYLVTTAFYISYFFMAIPSSSILERVGFKKGMALGLLVMAVGSLIFVPAAMSRQYLLFLLGLFVQGLGLSILQTASNPYITILGPIESAARRISVMGIANKVAGILSPIILGIIVLDGVDDLVIELKGMSIEAKNLELDALAEKVILPYIVMAVALVFLSVWIRYSRLPEIEEEGDAASDASTWNKLKSALKIPYLVLGFFAIFFYVGAEVIPVDSMGLYGTYLGFSAEDAGFFASFTLGGMLLGYVFGIIMIPRFISQQKLLLYFSILGIVFTVGVVLFDGRTSILFLALLGFANSIMWPAIWPLAIEGLGKLTKIGSALLIMGIAGGAILTPFFAKLTEWLNGDMQSAYLMLIVSYLYILFYAMRGHHIGKAAEKA
jgi:FHS family L-fucose permease-like MFS transporter